MSRERHKYELQFSPLAPVPHWARHLYSSIMERMDHLEHLIQHGVTHEQRMMLGEAYAILTNDIQRIDDALKTGTAAPVRTRLETSMPKSIEEVLAAVRAASTRTDSIIADRTALKKQVDDALKNVTIPADVQAKLDEIFDIETADAQKIDAALNANVPPADINPNATSDPAAQAPVGDRGGPVARETTADNKRDQA
jgi:hypothetical protein